eukprot:719841-Pleurochrysis_carterae.AAC.1
MLLVCDLFPDPATVQHVSGVSPLFLAFTPETVTRVLSKLSSADLFDNFCSARDHRVAVQRAGLAVLQAEPSSGRLVFTLAKEDIIASSHTAEPRTCLGTTSTGAPASAQASSRASVPSRFDFIHAATISSFRSDGESPLAALAELK